MANHVISHRKPRRKRAGWWGFAFRRFGALAVTTAAMAMAAWLAPYYYSPPPAPPAVEVAEAPISPPKLTPPTDITKTILVADAGLAGAEETRPRRARRGVPLDANAGDAREDFEVLSAGELDAISQARD